MSYFQFSRNLAIGDLTVTGNLVVNGTSTFDNHLILRTGVAVTAANYSIGRNADATNLTQFNVPTGASFEFSINDGQIGLWNATGLSIGTTVPTHALMFGSSSTGIALYNTADQTTNYERGTISWASNVLEIEAEVGGSGTPRAIQIKNTLAAGGYTELIVQRNAFPFFEVDFVTTAMATAGNFYLFTSTATITPTSGTVNFVSITPTYNETSGTAANTDLLINRTQTAVGSGAQNLIDAQVASSSMFKVSNVGLITASAINSLNATSSTLTIQSQTFTAGALHNAVTVSPTWAAEDQGHRALKVIATQNGANSSVLTALRIEIVKATATTTLAQGSGIIIATPVVTGTITQTEGLHIVNQSIAGSTVSYAIIIESQTANATTTRAIEIQGTGANNAIRLGSSPNIYSSGAEVINFMDSTAARGITMTLTAAGNQTVVATAGSLVLTAFTKGIQGTDLASANNMGVPTSNYVDVTGTTQINTMAATNITAGTIVTLQFDGSVTVKHNTAGTGAVFQLVSGDFAATAGDTLTTVYDGTNWREVARAVI